MEIMHRKGIANFVSALFSVSEQIELSATVEVVEQVPEKEVTPPPVEPGQ